MKVITCAAVILENDKAEILLAQRPEGKPMAGLWEFPGGKLETAESPEEALSRELTEELAITVNTSDMEPYRFVSHSYGEGVNHKPFHLVMLAFKVTAFTGTAKAQEGQTLKWVAKSALTSYLDKTPEADIPLMQELITEARQVAAA